MILNMFIVLKMQTTILGHHFFERVFLPQLQQNLKYDIVNARTRRLVDLFAFCGVLQNV